MEIQTEPGAEKRGADSVQRLVMPLALGTKTRWGKIGMVGFTGGERYYWMTDKHGCVSMMPACIVEKRHNAKLSDD